ncbi:MAG: copper chaperone PCu(A)C, partial [Gammaproteobacteria bacterium]
NSADHPIALVGAQSPQFETVELRGAVGGPEAAQHVQVPAHGELTLTPGGLHLFLSEPRSPLSRGDMIDLVLSFDNGQMEELMLPLEAAHP